MKMAVRKKNNKEDHDVDIFNIIQNVQDTVIHLKVDEELCCCCCLKKNQNAPRPFLLFFCCLHIKNRSDLYPVPSLSYSPKLKRLFISERSK